jgi:putative RecB family exonuclease
MTDAGIYFKEAWDIELGDKDLTNARVSGTATKANPNKEDVNFWLETGPKWVQGYIDWRNANPDWKIWTAPDGNRAIELGLIPEFAGVPVKMVIDRVFEVNGELVIVDLKTSKTTPTNPLQLGFYKVGLQKQFGIDIKWGSYWMARKFGISTMVDLSIYTEEKLEYFVENFDKARKSGIFLPNTNNCQYKCGLTAHCQFSTKIGK